MEIKAQFFVEIMVEYVMDKGTLGVPELISTMA